MQRSSKQNRNRNRMSGLVVLVAGAAMMLAGADRAHAAAITYGTAYNLNSVDQTLWPNTFDPTRNGGVSGYQHENVKAAVSYGNGSGVVPNINGMVFTELSGSTDWWGHGGINASIDEVLSGHTNAAGVTTFTQALTGLTIGNTYQVQVIVAHDVRGCCGDRQYEVGYGTTFTSVGTAPILTRYAYGNSNPATPTSYGGVPTLGTVVGTFTADAKTQFFALRSNTQDGNGADDVDPGISGYVLIESAPQWVTLVDEVFSNGGAMSASTNPDWFDNDSSPNGFEAYDSTGAGARDMNSAYDHDNNPGTADVTIPGGVEVNHDAGPVTLTARFDLPSLLDEQIDGVLAFYAGFRNTIAGNPPTVALFNVTDARFILDPTNILFNANDNIWNLNVLRPDLIAADAGDTVELRFYGGGSGGADGLQLADLEFRVALAPAPAALPAGLALLTLGCIRRRGTSRR